MVKDPRTEILTALKALRLDIREVAEGFLLRKGAEVETLCEYLLKLPAARIKKLTPPSLRKIRELKLKPAKGRIKDLKKLDNLLAELLDCVIEADNLEVKQKSPGIKKSVTGKAGGDPAKAQNS